MKTPFKALRPILVLLGLALSVNILCVASFADPDDILGTWSIIEKQAEDPSLSREGMNAVQLSKNYIFQ